MAVPGSDGPIGCRRHHSLVCDVWDTIVLGIRSKTHFRNSVMQEVRHRLRAEHHFVSVYSPWANGAVERVNRELVRLMRTLLAEGCLTPAAWPSVLMLTQATINNTAAEVRLAGQSPSQVMFGTDQIQPLDSVLGLTTDDVLGSREDAEAAIRHHGTKLAALLQKRWDAAREGRRTQVERTQRRDAARKVCDIDFEIGDYVLVYVTRQRTKLRQVDRPFSSRRYGESCGVYM